MTTIPTPDNDPASTRRYPWWTPWLAAAVAALLVVGVGSWIVGRQPNPTPMGGDGMGSSASGLPPVVTGYYDGDPIGFIHTEASDAKVAGMLTDMMDGSPVLHVPALADAPDSMLATVYVFTNGVQPDGDRGPFGFQPDVFDTVPERFDSAPGGPGYQPLRQVQLVEWSTRRATRADQHRTDQDGPAVRRHHHHPIRHRGEHAHRHLARRSSMKNVVVSDRLPGRTTETVENDLHQPRHLLGTGRLTRCRQRMQAETGEFVGTHVLTRGPAGAHFLQRCDEQIVEASFSLDDLRTAVHKGCQLRR